MKRFQWRWLLLLFVTIFMFTACGGEEAPIGTVLYPNPETAQQAQIAWIQPTQDVVDAGAVIREGDRPMIRQVEGGAYPNVREVTLYGRQEPGQNPPVYYIWIQPEPGEDVAVQPDGGNGFSVPSVDLFDVEIPTVNAQGEPLGFWERMFIYHRYFLQLGYDYPPFLAFLILGIGGYFIWMTVRRGLIIAQSARTVDVIAINVVTGDGWDIPRVDLQFFYYLSTNPDVQAIHRRLGARFESIVRENIVAWVKTVATRATGPELSSYLASRLENAVQEISELSAGELGISAAGRRVKLQGVEYSPTQRELLEERAEATIRGTSNREYAERAGISPAWAALTQALTAIGNAGGRMLMTVNPMEMMRAAEEESVAEVSDEEVQEDES